MAPIGILLGGLNGGTANGEWDDEPDSRTGGAIIRRALEEWQWARAGLAGLQQVRFGSWVSKEGSGYLVLEANFARNSRYLGDHSGSEALPTKSRMTSRRHEASDRQTRR